MEYVEVADDSDDCMDVHNIAPLCTNGPPVAKRPPSHGRVSATAAKLSQMTLAKGKKGSPPTLECSANAGAGIRRAVEQLQRANAVNANKTCHDLSKLDFDDDEEQLLVVCDFVASGQTQMSVKKGDLVMGNVSQVTEQRGWLWALLLRTGDRGFIPAAYTQPCRTDARGDVATQL